MKSGNTDLEPEAPILSSSGGATFPDNSESAGRPDPPPLLSSSGGATFPDQVNLQGNQTHLPFSVPVVVQCFRTMLSTLLQPIAAGKLRIVGVAEWQNVGKQGKDDSI